MGVGREDGFLLWTAGAGLIEQEVLGSPNGVRIQGGPGRNPLLLTEREKSDIQKWGELAKTEYRACHVSRVRYVSDSPSLSLWSPPVVPCP